MNDRLNQLLGLPAVVLAALFGVALIGVQPSAAPKGESPPASEPKPDTASHNEDGGDPLSVLRKYDFKPQQPDTEPTVELQRDVEWKLTPNGASVTVRRAADGRRPKPLTYDKNRPCEFLIACVPDPIDSKFAGDFDSAVHAAQRAYESRGYILHSSWLPWPKDPRAAAAASAAADPPHRRNPGALLFRKERMDPHDPGGVAVVWLVGENPIFGLHRAALYKALDLTADCGWFPKYHNKSIPVVGPWTSGSQDGLADTLKKWRVDRRSQVSPWTVVSSPIQFRVISGSVTAPQPDVFFNTPEMTFRTTVVPSRQVTYAILDYLAGGSVRRTERPIPLHYYTHADPPKPEEAKQNCDAKPPPEGCVGYVGGATANGPTKAPEPQWPSEVQRLGKIAILRESDTGYGARRLNGQTQYLPPHLDLPFPVSISQLKLDMEKAFEDPDRSAVALKPEFTLPKLSVPTEQHLGGPPLYDRASTAAVTIQALRDILRVIDREDVKLVGITATDPRDVLFLNKLLRKHAPKVQVFTTCASTVLLRPDEAHHMRGVVVGSTYPLYPDNQRWVRGDFDRRLSFPSDSVQGFYNAVLAHTDRDKMFEYKPPGFAPPASRPPVWVSMIGQNGTMVPLHCYSSYFDAFPLMPTAAAVTGGPVMAAPTIPSILLAVTGGLGMAKQWPPEASDRIVFDSYDSKFIPGAWGEKIERSPDPVPHQTPGFKILLLMAAVVAWVFVFGIGSGPRFGRYFRAGPFPRLSPEHEPTTRLLVAVGRAACWTAPLLFLVPTICLGVYAAVCIVEMAQPGTYKTFLATINATVLLTVIAVFGVLAVLIGWCLRSEQRHAVAVIIAAVVIVAAVIASRLCPRRKWWCRAATAIAVVDVLARWCLWREPRYVAAAVVWGVAFVIGSVYFGDELHPTERFLLFARSADLAAGVSPLVPMTLLACALYTFGLVHLRQAERFRSSQVACPFGRKSPDEDLPGDLARVVKADKTAREEFGRFLVSEATLQFRRPKFAWPRWYVVVAVAWVCLAVVPMAFLNPLRSGSGSWSHWLLWACGFVPTVLLTLVPWSVRLGEPFRKHKFTRRWEFWVVLVPFLLFGGWLCSITLPSIEGRGWDLLMRGAVWATGVAVALTLVRFLALWSAVKNLLNAITKLRLARAFETLPAECVRAFNTILNTQKLSTNQLAVAVQQAGRVRIEGKLAVLAVPIPKGWKGWDEELDANRRILYGPAGDKGDSLEDADRRTRLTDSLCDMARHLAVVLQPGWDSRSVDEAFGRSADAKPADADLSDAEPKTATSKQKATADEPKVAADKQIAEAERFLAVMTVLYVGQFFAQLRQIATALAVCSLLLLLALASYPFQPERPLLVAVMGLAAAVVAGIVYVLYDGNRNEFISRILRTTPNQFTPDRGFLSSLTVYVLPVVGVAFAQLTGFVRVLVDPILGVLR